MKTLLFVKLRSIIARHIYNGDLQKRRELKKKYHLKYRYLQHIVFKLLYGSDIRKLSLAFSTDKWGSHYYSDIYNLYFMKFKKKKINVLEIGIGGYDDPELGGNSLRMWRTFFSKAHIYGIDIYDKSPHNENRITTMKGSQIDDCFLEACLNKMGHVEIIIDDGSHVNSHVIHTFCKLFPKLSVGGIYVVEDTQTSYWEQYGGNKFDFNDPATSMGFFKSLVDGINYAEYKGKLKDVDYYDKHIVGMHFYHNMVIIEKGQNCNESNILPLVVE